MRIKVKNRLAACGLRLEGELRIANCELRIANRNPVRKCWALLLRAGFGSAIRDPKSRTDSPLRSHFSILNSQFLSTSWRVIRPGHALQERAEIQIVHIRI